MTVMVVDDDRAMRESLGFLLRSADYRVRIFSSAQEFLAAYQPSMRGCLLLDVRMPGMTGLDLQEQLKTQEFSLPIVMMTGYADVPMAVRAMRAGAVDFIEKPFNEQLLLDCVAKALKQAGRKDREGFQIGPIRKAIESLTPREREVMHLVVQGLLNKQIASELSVSMKTIEQHRARMMEKMGAGSLAELVRMAVLAEFDKLQDT